MNRTILSRREILAGIAALATSAMLPRLAFAQQRSQQGNVRMPPFARYRVGNANVTVLYGGYTERPVKGFVTNQSLSVVMDRLSAISLDVDTLQMHDSVVVVDYGGQLAIVGPGPATFIEAKPEQDPTTVPLPADNGGDAAADDSGDSGWDDSNGWDDDKKGPTGEGRVSVGTSMTNGVPTWLVNFRQAGFSPDKVEALIFSNMRDASIDLLKPDENGAYLFPKARPLVPQAEWDHWMTVKEGEQQGGGAVDADTQRIRAVFTPIEKDVLRFPPGVELTPGLAGIMAPGFTPSHNAFVLTSENKTLLIPSEALPLPFMALDVDWTCATEMNGEAAVDTRRMLLEGALTQKNLLLIKSAPLPNVGNLKLTPNGPVFEPLNPETAIAQPGQNGEEGVGEGAPPMGDPAAAANGGAGPAEPVPGKLGPTSGGPAGPDPNQPGADQLGLGRARPQGQNTSN